jgi:hypothetical protein
MPSQYPQPQENRLMLPICFFNDRQHKTEPTNAAGRKGTVKHPCILFRTDMPDSPMNLFRIWSLCKLQTL